MALSLGQYAGVDPKMNGDLRGPGQPPKQQH
jgi:hypothetical protein